MPYLSVLNSNYAESNMYNYCIKKLYIKKLDDYGDYFSDHVYNFNILVDDKLLLHYNLNYENEEYNSDNLNDLLEKSKLLPENINYKRTNIRLKPWDRNHIIEKNIKPYPKSDYICIHLGNIRCKNIKIKFDSEFSEIIIKVKPSYEISYMFNTIHIFYVDYYKYDKNNNAIKNYNQIQDLKDIYNWIKDETIIKFNEYLLLETVYKNVKYTARFEKYQYIDYRSLLDQSTQIPSNNIS